MIRWIRRLKVRLQLGSWWVDVERLNKRAGYEWDQSVGAWVAMRDGEGFAG